MHIWETNGHMCTKYEVSMFNPMLRANNNDANANNDGQRLFG